MPHVIDQLGRTIFLPRTPRRIVSLVPSQTELLADLGLENEVVGITKFCVHPPAWKKTKSRVGGTKNVRIDTLHALEPDLIIANKEENEPATVTALQERYPVWVSDVHDLPSALHMIHAIGDLCDRTDIAKELVTDIERAFAQLATQIGKQARPRVAYVIWQDPVMVAGGDTFINAMLDQAGLENVFADQQRYPATDAVHLRAKAPDYILLSSEPYPFQEKHRAEWQRNCPTAVIVLVDGEAFSWYGSRLLQAAPYFANLRTQLVKNPA